MKAPLDLTIEELNIYTLLYKKADWSSWEADYTLEQLVLDSHKKLMITKRQVMKIIEKFINAGYLEVVRKGTKGNHTIYKIHTGMIYSEQRTEYVPNVYQMRTESVTNEEPVPTLTGDDGNECVPNAYRMRTVTVPPISKTNNKNNKTIYDELFTHYISAGLIQHKHLDESMKKGIDTAIKTLGCDVEEMKRMIDRHKKKVDSTKNDGKYQVKARRLGEFFGQKKHQSVELICSDYSDDAYESQSNHSGTSNYVRTEPVKHVELVAEYYNPFNGGD